MRHESMHLKLKGAITSEDVLGKDVVDSSGYLLGVSDKFYLDPKTMRVLGISVDKGFLRTGYVISTNYIDEVTDHAVILNMQPSVLLKGKLVFSSEGALIGKISQVDLVQDTNAISALTVKRGFFRKIEIPVKYVKAKEGNVFLTITKAELEKSMQR